LQLKRSEEQNVSLLAEETFKEDYMLHYMLDVEARDSLLDLKVFETPFDYHLNIANSTVGATIPTKVDLVETFNYLIGLWVKRIHYVSDCALVQGTSEQDGRVLVIWRDLRKTDNKKLESLFREWKIEEREDAPEVIYVNGDNTLMNLREEGQTWHVKLIEEKFHRMMFGDSY
jgi:adenine-specific DNA-methyltransferase